MNYTRYLMSQTLLIIKVKRLAWAGHLVRVNNDRTSMGRALGACEQ
jgi:hypothetical protein